MATTVLNMSMSVDGFITGPNPSLENALGDGGEQLHAWIFGGGDPDKMMGDGSFAGLTGADKQVVDELMSTGAVVAGRGTFEPANGWGGDHHDGVPIFIVARDPAEAEAAIGSWPLVRYIADVGEAISAARDAAGEKEILVHGASVGQRALAAGILDELELHVVPVLFGSGRRLFDEGAGHVDLERTRALTGESGVTHLRYRVRR